MTVPGSLAWREIADAATTLDLTLELLHTDVERRVLVVRRHKERPVTELVFCHRRCNANPTEHLKTMVQALSGGRDGVRAFSGESCKLGFYIGNNIWGRNFDERTTFCPGCGHLMTGPEIDHVEIVKCDDDKWNQKMIEQCEIGASWFEGKNYGLTYNIRLDS